MLNKIYFNVKKEKCVLAQTSCLDGEFYCVLNSQAQIVATCNYNIIKVFNRDLTRRDIFLRDRHNLNQTIVERMTQLTITSKEMPIYKKLINDNSLLVDGQAYKLRDAYCQLDNIEIKNKDYYKIGVGSFIIKNLQNYAIQQKCTRIQGWYFPNGDFIDGSKDFYVRNGFEFVEDKNKTYVIKHLQIEN